ncbi:MAG: type II toxin-antitoxin system RelE/ParE family toxin [Planctomycetaceae bacterium]
MRYHFLMIRSFHDHRTEKIFRRDRVKGVSQEVQRATLRKLLLIDAADSLNDLKVPPGNRLEKLKGDRQGQYSVRVNDQWRICFTWANGDAAEVEFTDYH